METQQIKTLAAEICGGLDVCNDGNLAVRVENILSSIVLVLGIVAVVFIIVGGVQYMTSSGDASKTQKAKNTILYAVIGLVVCALAFIIVNFVIGII